jgi:ribose transport system permease protein
MKRQGITVNSIKNTLLNNLNFIRTSKTFVLILFIVGLFIIGQLIAPGFAHLNHIMNILSLSSFLGIVALGQMIVIVSGSEGIDLSVGSVMTLGAVIGSQVINGFDSNLFFGILIVIGTGAFIGLLNGLGITLMRIPPLIMTLSMGTVIQGFAIMITGGQPKGRASDLLIELSTGRIWVIPYNIIFWLLIAGVAVLLIKYSRWGILIYGVGENPTNAKLSGVRIQVIRTSAFIISGVVAGIGGLLQLGYTGTSFLDLGNAFIMPSVAAVVIGGVALSGGKGSYGGVIAGVILLTLLTSLLITLRMGEAGRQIVYGGVLMTLLIIYTRSKQ